MTDTCRNGHARTPENTRIRADGYPRCMDCEREYLEAHPGYVTQATRRYRSDPEKRERDRAASRRWKAANRERTRAYERARRKEQQAR